jgi:hypothetical protein
LVSANVWPQQAKAQKPGASVPGGRSIAMLDFLGIETFFADGRIGSGHGS